MLIILPENNNHWHDLISLPHKMFAKELKQICQEGF
jgi:hypothetical protein